MADRPAQCGCGKRLSRKTWYYRNGTYYCKRSCWETAQKKIAAEAAKAAAEKPAEKPVEKPAETEPKTA